MRIIQNTTHIPTEELKPLLIEWAQNAGVSIAKLRVRCLKPIRGNRGMHYPFGYGIVLRSAEDCPIETLIHIWIHELQHEKFRWLPWSRRHKIKNHERWCEENTVKILAKHNIPIVWTGYKVRKKFAANIKMKYGVEIPKHCIRGHKWREENDRRS